ncbi:putative proline racemase [Aspergillus saccharolyticus JOP 1030-1]|uniref:trans-L-3-hydroxyproline dehydratase n=1 Tax=Aspergillus saccharolyticus JOP 1030-1 TaxID=1450539 RepID=A0A318ZNE8_9EURO|nr:putative proline racemase [Aspergillus saccharolyticus JOP 1030-1]PYH48497.1 putative proline racemase [Aspergillus saccharolyticus JOP 1030-1]
MDVSQTLAGHPTTIHCIDMHTTGQPTRIIYAGYPKLTGTLLAQRDQAREHHDHIRQQLMLEPRGNPAMYGAIICPETELVRSGEADVGVLFVHNEGYSTMCGHATLALGRFLIDTHDTSVFPRRPHLAFNASTQTIQLRLHAPCGVVSVRVPTNAAGTQSDPSRPVAFLSTPAYATALQLTIPIPAAARWPELPPTKHSITLDISYGGAFYAIVPATELGFFAGGLRGGVDLAAITRCMQQLKPYLERQPEVVAAVQHPEDPRLSFLYSIMIVDSAVGLPSADVAGAETGLCYFADNQIDRSPTGSCVTARMALAHAKGKRPVGLRWAYHSLVSNHFGTDEFCAEVVEEVEGRRPSVIVRVEGRGFYTGTASFMVEAEDRVSRKGFTMEGVAAAAAAA